MRARPTRRTALTAGALAATSPLLPAYAAEANPAAPPGTPTDDPWSRVPAILARIRPPRFPQRRYDVRDFGAVGDGVTKNTAAIRRAIDVCHRAGGGHVVVPAGGRFLTGAIRLRSRVNLRVDGTVLFSTDPADYLPMVLTRWEGTECWNYSPFVYAHGERDLAVTGHGTLDGQGMDGPWKSWRDPGGGQPADQAELRRMGEQGVPVEQRLFGAGHFLRPNMVQFYRCRNVLIQDVTVLEPAMWTLHPVLCTNVLIKDVDVIGRINNSDGVDPECCADVLITGCRFHTEDDSVAVKSGRDEDGHRVGVPSRNIVVRDCVFSGRWGGIAVGSEMSGGAYDIFAEDCRINPLDFPGRHNPRHPVFLKTSTKRGGAIDGVYVRNFTGRQIDRDCVYLTTRYSGQTGPYPAVIRDVRVEHMVHDGARRALHLEGLASDPFGPVRVAHCDFTGMSEPNLIEAAPELRLHKVYVNGSEVHV
ncbi:glycoside hydrolase family 28 protein [Streptomyces lasiicapitis]|uniref:glycoside hydrolase family 28 protein n=1 Tax=Streptomyces lasiicapitis TaxID=1923961 RepID=UPI0036A2A8DF